MNIKKEPVIWHESTHCGKTPRALVIYLMAFFAMAIFPADSYLPSLPFIQEHFGMSDTGIQSSVTIFLLAMAIGSLLFAPASHHLGRKPTLLMACIGFIIGSLLCVFAPNDAFFLSGRLIQGLGATGLMTLGRTIIRDVFSGGQVVTVSSYTIPVVSTAIAVAPMIGGYLQDWYGWQGTFWFCIAAYTLILLFVLFDFPETTPHDQNNDVGFFSSYLTLIKSAPFVCFTTTTGLAMGFIMAYQTMAPLLLQTTLGLSPVEFGWLGLIACIAMSVAAWINHRFLDTLGSNNMLYLGSVLIITASMMALISGLLGWISVPWIVLPFMLGLVGCTLTFTNAFSKAMTPWPHLASFAAALYNTWQYAVASVASGIAALVPETNQVPMGLIWLALGIVHLCFVFLGCKSAAQSTKSKQST